MLSQIVVEGANPLTIPVIGATPKSSLLLRNITGLGPADINLYLGEYARDGGVYQGRRSGFRNIVITLDLNPDPTSGETVSSLREALYVAFMNPTTFADYVKLNFVDSSGATRYIVGYVEKFDPDLFASNNTVQISLICPDPYFRDEDLTTLTYGPGVRTITSPPYSGTAPSGFNIRVKADISSPTLFLTNNILPGPQPLNLYWIGRLYLSAPSGTAFYAGDVAEFNTTRGERSAVIYRGGVGAPVSILSWLSPYAQWPEMHPQDNAMAVSRGASPDSYFSVLELEYRPAYWGV